MIDELELETAHAEAIIEKAIEFEVYTDEMPSSKKDKMEAAHEIVAFAIDSWVNDGMRPDADDEGEAKAGEMIVAILEIAGVEIDDDDEVTYGEAPELDGDDDDNDDDGDGEAAFDIDDIIEGYEELTPATRLKKIKALELDPEDTDDYNTLVGIAEWEEEQDKPASRVLDYLNDVIPPEDDDETADDAGDGEDDGEDEAWDEESLGELDKDELKEAAEEFDVDFPAKLTAAAKKKVIKQILEAQEAAEDDNDDDNDGEDSEEPWEGYDDTSLKDIKAALKEAQEDEDEPLTGEQVEMVIEYEEANENRKTLVKWLNELLEEVSEDDNDDDDADAEGEAIEISEEALGELDTDDLKEVAAQYEIEVTGRLTAAKKKKLIAEIIEAAEEGDDDDNTDDEPEEKPKGRSRRGSKKDTPDPDEDDAADEAKANDDRKDAKKGKGGTLIITRAQILTALEKGEVEIKLG